MRRIKGTYTKQFLKEIAEEARLKAAKVSGLDVGSRRASFRIAQKMLDALPPASDISDQLRPAFVDTVQTHGVDNSVKSFVDMVLKRVKAPLVNTVADAAFDVEKLLQKAAKEDGDATKADKPKQDDVSTRKG